MENTKLFTISQIQKETGYSRDSILNRIKKLSSYKERKLGSKIFVTEDEKTKIIEDIKLKKEGFSTKDIAQELNVSEKTVLRRVQEIFPEKVYNGAKTVFSTEEKDTILREISKNNKTLTPMQSSDNDRCQMNKQCQGIMTVSQLAKVLNVNDETIKEVIRFLFPNKMKARKTTNLTEQEVTLIKARLTQNRHLATKDNPSRIADMPKTNLEKEILIRQVEQILQEEGATLISQIVEKQLLGVSEKLSVFGEKIEKQNELIEKVFGKAKFVGEVMSDFVEDTKGSILGKALFHGSKDKASKELADYLENKKDTVYFSDRKDFRGFKNIDYFTVTEVADMLQENKFVLFDLLKKHKLIFSRLDKDSSSIYKEGSNKYNCLIQAFEDFPSRKNSFFFMENTVTKNQKGLVVQETHQFYVSKRGIEFIQFLIEEEIESVERDSLMPNGIKFENPLFKMPFSFEELNETKPLKDFLKEYKIEDGFEKAYSFLYRDKTLDYTIPVPKRKFFKILNRLRLNEYALIIFKGALALQYAKEDVEANKAV